MKVILKVQEKLKDIHRYSQCFVKMDTMAKINDFKAATNSFGICLKKKKSKCITKSLECL